MFQLFSKSCAYALRALVFIPHEGRVSIQSVCQQSGLPEAYTRKAVQSLSQGGLLTAVTGPKGGYRLAKPPQNIKLLDIIKAIEGPDVFDRCVLGLPFCTRKAPCPVHSTWLQVRKPMLESLKKRTLKQLVDNTNKGET